MSASQLFAHKTGALGGGNDLAQGEHTIEEAARRCIELGKCSPSFPNDSYTDCNAPCLGGVSVVGAKGFTFQGREPNPRGRVLCYFKRFLSQTLSYARALARTQTLTRSLARSLTHSPCVCVAPTRGIKTRTGRRTRHT